MPHLRYLKNCHAKEYIPVPPAPVGTSPGRHRPASQSAAPVLYSAFVRDDPANRGQLGKVRSENVQVIVRDNNVDQALRALKKKMQREGIFREMKLRRSFEKPSERRAREKAEAIRRHRKLMRKRMDREGY